MMSKLYGVTFATTRVGAEGEWKVLVVRYHGPDEVSGMCDEGGMSILLEVRIYEFQDSLPCAWSKDRGTSIL